MELWSLYKFIEVNFINFIHYHLCKISSKIMECNVFAPYDFLAMICITLYQRYYYYYY